MERWPGWMAALVCGALTLPGHAVTLVTRIRHVMDGVPSVAEAAVAHDVGTTTVVLEDGRTLILDPVAERITLLLPDGSVAGSLSSSGGEDSGTLLYYAPPVPVTYPAPVSVGGAMTFGGAGATTFGSSSGGIPDVGPGSNELIGGSANVASLVPIAFTGAIVLAPGGAGVLAVPLPPAGWLALAPWLAVAWPRGRLRGTSRPRCPRV